ncbi:MAG: hypothetical protein Q7W30_05330 [Coriobacteriia bacterium]|nr:hypothetical protein [Coriobacteriia bacterium]
MQQRTTSTTTTARVAFLLVVAALSLQTAPVWASPAPGSRTLAGQHVSRTATRLAIDRAGSVIVRTSGAASNVFAFDGHGSAALVERFDLRPFEAVTLTLASGTGPVPAAGPTFVRRLRE